jgi:hypothetical protein
MEVNGYKLRPGAFLFSGKWAPVVAKFGETGMGYCIVGVTLANGREFSQCVLMGGYLTQVRGFPDVPFIEADIIAIRETHKKWDFTETP